MHSEMVIVRLLPQEHLNLAIRQFRVHPAIRTFQCGGNKQQQGDGEGHTIHLTSGIS